MKNHWQVLCMPLHNGGYKHLGHTGVNKMECSVWLLNSTQLSQQEDGVAFSR